jgi:NAD-dependent SIR2 family protein deacetylase
MTAQGPADPRSPAMRPEAKSLQISIAARDDAARLREFVDRSPRLFVLTGAGISTDSGIPGYRDTECRWQRSAPILLKDFLLHESTRQRYWARSMTGWPIVATAKPNAAHRALANLEADGRIEQLVTQNVDGLHQRAGSRSLVELHGNLASVACLDCGARHSRAAVQEMLESCNGRLLNCLAVPAPDGDADLERFDLASFRIPECARCSGTLKPDVVFFGEGVPRDRVDAASAALAAADAMLVLGSSLMVYSGYRFCERAAAMGKSIAAINLGRTRGDHLFSLKVESGCAEALTRLVGQPTLSWHAPQRCL